MTACYTRYLMEFNRPGGTSRGVLTTKETFFLKLTSPTGWGVGECAVFRGLSRDDRPDYEEKIRWACEHIDLGPEILKSRLADWPSLVFGLEQAFRSLASADPFLLFDGPFTSGEPIPINGLIWMGSPQYMEEQVAEKLEAGYRCLKFKIGALDFETEWRVLHRLRQRYPADRLEIRVDANGAFTPEEAPLKLDRLAELEVHSIEQPIRAGQWRAMETLCRDSPVPVALDEELIPLETRAQKLEVLDTVKPDYLILKPSLLGGYAACEDWIGWARDRGIGWWVTSALESNIGLNAIAQWTAGLPTELPQGLGTGSLFSNNFSAPLETGPGILRYRPEVGWDRDKIKRLCT